MSNPRSAVRVTREQLSRLTTDAQVIRFLESLMRKAPGDREAVTVGASPFTYLATADLSLTIAGGTVSQVAYQRNGVNTAIGVVAGVIPVLAGDAVVITYTVAPTVFMLPSE